MKITAIRKNGQKLNSDQMNELVKDLDINLFNAGFVTEVRQLNSTSVKVGLYMCSFRINPAKLGYNARANSITLNTVKKGFKRTTIPTWNQREDFNHIINNILDKKKLDARVKSGEFIVRDYDGRKNYWDMPEVFHNGYRLQVSPLLDIVPIKHAEEAVEWININAPFISVVPPKRSKYLKGSQIPF